MKCPVILVLLMPLSGMAQSDTNNRGINFEQQLTWNAVKAKAQLENKYIFLDVYTTWCAPCKKMDKEVYADSVVGDFINEKFISVKVQMDSTGKDGAQVKKWYADATQIKKDFAIAGYPGYLFFTPDGRLIYKDFGYKTGERFIKLAEDVLSSKNLMLSTALDDYKKGKRDYKIMGDLALYARSVGEEQLAKQIGRQYINQLNKVQLLTKPNILLLSKVIGDKDQALKLAKEYKEKVLNELPPNELLVYDNLEFIGSFRSLIDSKDAFFQAFYAKPDSIDKIVNKTGWSGFQVEQTIVREEIDTRIANDKNIDWQEIQHIIEKKYSKVDVHRIVLERQIRFYRFDKPDWKLWAKCKDRIIKQYPPQAEGLGIYLELNTSGAWDAFLHCNDKQTLRTAVKWIDLAIKKDKEQEAAYLDTKANLLYKLGKVKQAIVLEKKAIIIDDNNAKRSGKEKGQYADTFAQVLLDMKNRKPTYLEEGAQWDRGMLP